MTEQQQREDASLQREKRLAQFTSKPLEVFWMSDPEKGEILYVSSAYEEIWGRSRLGLSRDPEGFLENVHPEDLARAELFHRKKRSEMAEVVYRIVRPDGEIRWIHQRAVPVPDEAGEVYRVVGGAEDITARKREEEALVESRRMEAIGRLAGGIAHDFNNILMVIQELAAVVLQTDSLPREASDSVEQIRLESERATRLTKQLLVFSRRQTTQFHEMDLGVFVDQMSGVLERALGEGIQIRIEKEAGLPKISGDREMLEQIVLNLAWNARDAMPRGGRLTIKVESMPWSEKWRGNENASGSRAGRFVCLTVRDTGSGISSEHLPRVFEPFFTTKEQGRGTGLGLAAVYGAVKQHNGWIEAESELGAGAAFRAYFPAIPELGALGEGGGLGAKKAGRSETILLVEDEPALRQLIRRILVKAGYAVVEAECGLSALGVWREERENIDLLLTDLVMPGGLSGRDLACRLIQDKPELQIIFTSGYSQELAGKDLSILTNGKFLQKPYAPAKLIELIRECLPDRGGRL